MDHRPRDTRKPATPGLPSPLPTVPLAGATPGTAPDQAIGEARDQTAEKECSTCKDEPTSPDRGYRIVLRCTTTGLDH